MSVGLCPVWGLTNYCTTTDHNEGGHTLIHVLARNSMHTSDIHDNTETWTITVVNLDISEMLRKKVTSQSVY